MTLITNPNPAPEAAVVAAAAAEPQLVTLAFQYATGNTALLNLGVEDAQRVMEDWNNPEVDAVPAMVPLPKQFAVGPDDAFVFVVGFVPKEFLRNVGPFIEQESVPAPLGDAPANIPFTLN